MDEIIDRLKKVRRGAMFIIEAPSGTGKSAVVKEILQRDPHIKFSVSVTTRKPREGEVDGKDYYFINDKQYDEFLAQDAFYEYVDSQYGSRYGTLRSEVDSFINVGEDVLFDMDWEGARQMKIEHWDEFDYVIVNVNLEETILKVQKIISGERMKRVRQTGMKRFVNELIKEAKENE